MRELIKEAINDRILEKIQKRYLNKEYVMLPFTWKIIAIEPYSHIMGVIKITTDYATRLEWRNKISRQIRDYYNLNCWFNFEDNHFKIYNQDPINESIDDNIIQHLKKKFIGKTFRNTAYPGKKYRIVNLKLNDKKILMHIKREPLDNSFDYRSVRPIRNYIRTYFSLDLDNYILSVTGNCIHGTNIE